MSAVTVTPIDGWSPDQYERFRSERQQPFNDLLMLCYPVPGGRIVDLGCGTGDLTKVLHEEMEAKETVGVDSSPTMLERASSAYGDVPGLSFAQGDIATWLDEGLQLVFANASLHWVPHHAALLARLRFSLAPGGQLAFQVPATFDHPSHRLAREVAAEPAFAPDHDDGGPGPADNVLTPARYAEILHGLGAIQQHARLQVYGHLLPSVESVVEWVRGSLLSPIRARMDEPTFEAYLDRYRERLLGELGQRRPYFYAFSRILCWARFA